MTATSNAPSALTFPPSHFAKLSPHPYLLAHLRRPPSPSSPPVRPNGRHLSQFRPVTIHTGSLTHADGSTVVRTGDTAVVCGIRAEILLRRDVPTYRGRGSPSETQDLGLLVPNLELSTGCTPTNLPGSAPSQLAQTLTSRLLALLYSTDVVRAEDLQILHMPPPDPDTPDLEPEAEVVGWWVLHISVLFISLSGNGSALDAAWGAVMAALGDVRLPRAMWDRDLDGIVCDDDVGKAKRLRLRGSPFAATLGVVRGKKGERWVLADMDAFEEGAHQAPELVTVVGEGDKIKRIEMWNGAVGGKEEMRELVRLARERWKEWIKAMKEKTSNEAR